MNEIKLIYGGNTMNVDEFMEALNEALEEKGLVVFTGAGLSTASGIKDFRGENGLYKEDINAEEILSHHYMIINPKDFYQFFRDKLINGEVKPNLMHEVIASMQQKGIVNGIITQNIDGLDTMAGSKNVIELHGNANKFFCMDCKKKYSLNDVEFMDLVPRCECGGIIRPDIVLYEEPLEKSKIWSAKGKIVYAKTLLVLGSSLTVNPAASLVYDFVAKRELDKTKKLFIVNQGETDYDHLADYKYDGNIIDVAKKIKKTLNRF